MKCVMLINRDLPLGLIANTAAVLAVSLGQKFTDIVGEDLTGPDGSLHPGITQLPILILNGDDTSIREIRQKVIENPQPGLYYVDFCDAAQQSKVYDEYKQRLACTPPEQLHYLGLALCGSNKQIERLTGNIGLLR